jgi:apolipoprotein D and lipocalin family protein
MNAPIAYTSPRLLRSLSWSMPFVLAAGCTSAAQSTEVDAPAADPTLGALPANDTVDRVEVGQYLGKWYEVASIPQGFQARCAATTATYGAIDATTVSVLNECRLDTLDGDPVRIEGTATVVEPASNARLEVEFGFGRAPYWIVDLASVPAGEPYPWAIVSVPGRSSVWILSRTMRMADDRYGALLERLRARGYSTDKLALTLQPAP